MRYVDNSQPKSWHSGLGPFQNEENEENFEKEDLKYNIGFFLPRSFLLPTVQCLSHCSTRP
ncbi:alpha-xylosidase [Aspergillus lentulus]|nr:alpha-xylosidase [Aspergillus lentulus]